VRDQNLWKWGLHIRGVWEKSRQLVEAIHTNATD
jgi:hypothetical protein